MNDLTPVDTLWVPDPRTELAKLFKKTREESGLKQAEFARALNKTPAFLSQMENGIAIPGVELVRKMGRKFGADTGTIFALMRDVEISKFPEELRPEKDPGMVKAHAMPENHYPVIGLSACGSWIEAIADPREPSGFARSEPAPEGVAKHKRAFWAVAEGFSMIPKIEPGDMILVDPAREGRAAVKNKTAFVYWDGQSLIKKWTEKGDLIILESTNPAFEPVRIPKADWDERGGRVYLVVRIMKEP